MTSEEIKRLADTGGKASPDLDLNSLLSKVLVEFASDVVPSPSWRRRLGTLTILAGERSAALPMDFSGMLKACKGDLTPLFYIGTDPGMQLRVSTGQSDGLDLYDIEPPRTASTFTFTLNVAPTSDLTVHFLYRSDPWRTSTGIFNTDSFLAPGQEWAIVAGLKREILLDRLGINDPTYQAAKAEFDEWKIRASSGLQVGPEGDRFVTAI